jgi:ADP-ribosyl-[dinitrogen reductase] hydrolase
MPTHQEHIAGGLLGLLIGDAMGVPYEFHALADLPPYEEIEYVPPLEFDRSHQGVPPGTWSDDGAQALCLLASLLDCQGFDPDDFSSRLMNWYEDGYLAVDGLVFDVGITTSRAICNLRAGIEGIPCQWRLDLRGQALYQPLLNRLLIPREKDNTYYQ